MKLHQLKRSWVRTVRIQVRVDKAVAGELENQQEEFGPELVSNRKPSTIA